MDGALPVFSICINKSSLALATFHIFFVYSVEPQDYLAGPCGALCSLE